MSRQVKAPGSRNVTAPGEIVTLEAALAASREQIAADYQAHVNPAVYRLLHMVGCDLKFVRAEGSTVWDEQGRPYLDFLGGYGALNLGHNHPEVTDAVARVATLPNILQTSISGLAASLARTLAVVTPGALSKTFFCNSGTEAVESAMKLARISTGRSVIVSAEGGFHGKTLGALSITPKAKYQQPYAPLIPDTRVVPFDDLEALERALHKKDCAGFIVEPIQGEGGINVAPPGYLAEAARLCRRYGTLFMVDEIQSGLGRSGYMFAVEYGGIEPDVMTLAKSLGGGIMPIGACIATDAVWDKAYNSRENCLLHTSTFGGNSRACAAALKTIEVLIRDGLPAAAAARGDRLMRGVESIAERHPGLFKDVRGKGLMIGIEFEMPLIGAGLGREYLASLFAGMLIRDHQLITAYSLNNPKVLRLEPPLTVTDAEVDRCLAAISAVAGRVKRPTGVVLATGRYLLGSRIRNGFGLRTARPR